MNVTITPTLLRGAITPPPSKSQAHRLIIAAALAEGESVISNVALSQDIEATLGCMRALGAQTAMEGDTLTVRGIGPRRVPCGACMCGIPHLDCGESGSTLRFLIPVALAVAGGGIFTGRGRLLARPQKPYADLFAAKGIFFAQEAQAITVGGALEPGRFELPGDVSSQFATGLLYALPLLAGDSDVALTTPLESRGYVDMTLQALEQFGITVEERTGGWHVPGGQTYRPVRAAVEADWSQAGFWYAAAGTGHAVAVTGMRSGSAQGDRAIAGLVKEFDRPERIIDVSQIPDLAPPLAALAALRPGVTRLVNAARLRMKESDRLSAIADVLAALGASVEEGADFLTITGSDVLPGGVAVSGHNDHRIAMMAAIAAARCAAPVTVTGAECVAKSYPDFWEEYERLGGRIRREDTA